jgi:predicted nucleic-acid-binding protein
MVVFDTNAILRYILQDNQVMADEVEQQLLDDVCFIPVEVVAEIVYVL